MRTTRVELVAPPETPPPGEALTALIGMGGAAPAEHDWGRSIRWVGAHPDPDALRSALRPGAALLGWDAAVVTGPLATRPPGLLVTDVDSTLITAEVIDLLAELAGAGRRVADITERAMRGELDFAAALSERVGQLAGLPVQALAEVADSVRLSPGATALIGAAKAAGARVGLVSGGFIEVVGPLAAAVGADYARANRLEAEGGRLTGRTLGPIVDRHEKVRCLEGFAERAGARPSEAVAIGDGANDLAMLGAAGLGIAYRAKPAAARAADAEIRFPRLDAARAFALL